MTVSDSDRSSSCNVAKPVEVLPRLGIAHLLLFMTGMCITLAIAFANRIPGSGWEKRIGEMLLVGDAVVPGAGGAFLAWVGVRWLYGKKLPLVDPGAKFAFILTTAILLNWVLSLVVLTLLWLTTNSIFLVFAVLPPMIAVFIGGFLWIKETPWRVIVAAQALTTVICLFPLSTAVGAGALIYASIQDRRNKYSRHWTHYLGVLLWFFGQVSVL